ncbi:TPA: DNA cytosine methyltransferase [Escherichia coli]|nr:DNA cytosine methyltransferase [Escherichia coli]HAX5190288.1 DNA cytosine methyltransferase [Escherichia coli]HAX5223000.1 DNA cytosine methyltransferase [Escherichia coli]HAX5236768.1 DNA cytosine methyltransferase [Escherichia coli]HAX5287814.1 DNA cytosine methyltransferase [Escherichia coli]
MTAYYNEIDPFAAQWLRNLIDAGHIAPGVVDTRSIEDVTPNDLKGFIQCHFFAGIGGWPLALRLSGWSDDRPIWTGSCPCQPFSTAGKGKRFTDERHLWPAFHWLIGQCRPVVVVGEQSGSSDANDWIDLVQVDVESLGYAFGAVAFPSAGVGAPHVRDRSYWVADSNREQYKKCVSGRAESYCQKKGGSPVELAGFCLPGGLADSCGAGWERGIPGRESAKRETFNGHPGRGGANCRPGPVNGFWGSADWLFCQDGKWRAVESTLKPLVDGFPGRVGRLRAYGNAVNAYAATAFVKAYMAAVK